MFQFSVRINVTERMNKDDNSIKTTKVAFFTSFQRHLTTHSLPVLNTAAVLVLAPYFYTADGN